MAFLFAGFISAIQRTYTELEVFTVTPFAVMALDVGEAKGKAYCHALEAYPPEQGYIRHDVGLLGVEVLLRAGELEFEIEGINEGEVEQP